MRLELRLLGLGHSTQPYEGEIFSHSRPDGTVLPLYGDLPIIVQSQITSTLICSPSEASRRMAAFSFSLQHGMEQLGNEADGTPRSDVLIVKLDLQPVA